LEREMSTVSKWLGEFDWKKEEVVINDLQGQIATKKRESRDATRSAIRLRELVDAGETTVSETDMVKANTLPGQIEKARNGLIHALEMKVKEVVDEFHIKSARLESQLIDYAQKQESIFQYAKCEAATMFAAQCLSLFRALREFDLSKDNFQRVKTEINGLKVVIREEFLTALTKTFKVKDAGVVIEANRKKERKGGDIGITPPVDTEATTGILQCPLVNWSNPFVTILEEEAEWKLQKQQQQDTATTGPAADPVRSEKSINAKNAMLALVGAEAEKWSLRRASKAAPKSAQK